MKKVYFLIVLSVLTISNSVSAGDKGDVYVQAIGPGYHWEKETTRASFGGDNMNFGVGVGFNTKSREGLKSSEEKSVVEKELKKTFAPEFLNRIDDVITFNSLEREEITKIISLELDKLKNRVKDLEFELELTDSALDLIVENGFDPQYGARPLKRAIQRYVEDVLTEEIITNNPEKGSKLLLDYNKEDDKMFVSIKKNTSSKKKKND